MLQHCHNQSSKNITCKTVVKIWVNTRYTIYTFAKKKKKTRRQTSKGRRAVDFANRLRQKKTQQRMRQYRISEPSSAIRNYTGINVTPIYRDAELRINIAVMRCGLLALLVEVTHISFFSIIIIILFVIFSILIQRDLK